jgi:hypothetical protein
VSPKNAKKICPFSSDFKENQVRNHGQTIPFFFSRHIIRSTHSSSDVPPLSNRRAGSAGASYGDEIPVDTCVIGDNTGSGLLLQTLHVTLLTDLKGAGAMDLQKILRSNNAPDFFTILFQRGNKSGQGNNSCLQEEVDHFTDAADILTTVFHAETQIGTETMTHIVAVKDKGSTPQSMQAFFHSMGEGGFPRTRKPGKPQVHGLVII